MQGLPECRKTKSMAHHSQMHSLDESALYRIRYQGVLDRSWSSRLSGMKITQLAPTGEEHCVELAGRLVDQAALLGVLNCLYDLGLCLVSVERQDRGQSS